MKIAYNILPTKGKERPALPSDGSGSAWKLVYIILWRNGIMQVHQVFSSFIDKYLPYLKFFQSGALQYFDWFQSPKHLILGTHYAYSNRDGWWTAAWSLYGKLWSTIWWILIGSRDLGGSGTTLRRLTFSLQHVCKIVLHTYITWPFTKMYGSFHATMKNKFPKEDSPH